MANPRILQGLNEPWGPIPRILQGLSAAEPLGLPGLHIFMARCAMGWLSTLG